MLHLDELTPCTPHLPRRRMGTLMQLAASAAVHVPLVVIAVALSTAMPPGELQRAELTSDRFEPRIVFIVPELPQIGRGGGGGGNQQPHPIRRAQGIGSDPITLRVRESPLPPSITTPSLPVIEDVEPPPSILLDAKPLASGLLEQIGLPTVGDWSGTSTGPGSGGGVGSGSGTGIGSGRGPGLGPGSGGGTGAGVYRPGGAVSAPRLITKVKHKYSTDAFVKRVQGTVVLEAIVTNDGCPSQIRVVKSLDPGLDQEALAAVAQWRFEPGRLDGEPVDVLVTILLDFWIR